MVQYLVRETTTVQVILDLEKRRAVLTLKSASGETIDQEVWVYPEPMRKGELKETGREVFDDTYDYLNFLVHGLPATD